MINKIPKYPAIYQGKLVVEFVDYNDNYWYMRYCEFSYLGDPLKSNLFQLWPKDRDYNPSEILLSENGKCKGRYYLQMRGDQRWYIPVEFYAILELHVPAET